MPPSRYRRCPQCKGVRRASEFKRAPRQVVMPGPMERRTCPQCGHIAPLKTFPLTDPPQPDEREPR